jgi:hypothetical protein
LESLFDDEGWRERGRRGREYVERVHEVGRVVDMHLEIYRGILESGR